MGFKDFFKVKEKRKEDKDREITIPTAPGKEELPELPSAEEIPEFKEVEKKLSPLEIVEKKAFDEQREELDERDELTLRKPIFVYLEQYQEMINEVGIMQNTLKEGDDSLSRISEFKEDEDKEFKKWEGQLKDMQRKLIFADKTLFANKGR